MPLTQQELLFLLQGVNVENPMLACVCRELADHMSKHQPQQAQKKMKPDAERTKQHDLIEPEAAKVMEAFFDSCAEADRQQTEIFLREELKRRGITEDAPSEQQSSGSRDQ